MSQQNTPNSKPEIEEQDNIKTECDIPAVDHKTPADATEEMRILNLSQLHQEREEFLRRIEQLEKEKSQIGSQIQDLVNNGLTPPILLLSQALDKNSLLTGRNIKNILDMLKKISGDITNFAENLGSETPEKSIKRFKNCIEAATAAAKENSAETEAKIELPDSRKGSVLIVDDEEIIRMLIEGTLNINPHVTETDSAQDAEEALKKFKEKNGFDILITDINMPGTNGVDLALKLKEQYPGLNIIFITGDGKGRLKEAQKAFEKQGGKTPEGLTKPFSPSDLTELVDKAIDPNKE